MTQLITQADRVLPRHKPGVQKYWWTDDLTCLRDKSIEIHRIWRLEGKPRSGPTNDERCRVRASYKQAIKLAQRKPKQTCWNRLHSSFLSKDTTAFWKSWKQVYNKKQTGLQTVVNGVTSHPEIAESFKNHFVKVSKPNNQSRVDDLEREFTRKYQETVSNHSNCSCSSHYVTLNYVIDVV